jgi:taurine dioxygenase
MWEVRVSPGGAFDNSAREYRHIAVAPLAAAMGAEVVGLRLPDLSDEAFAEFQDALWRHKMLFLRDQHLTHAEHEAFARRLGPFAVDAYTQGVPGHRDVHPIIKEADVSAKAVFGGGWHTDSPFLPEPPSTPSRGRRYRLYRGVRGSAEPHTPSAPYWGCSPQIVVRYISRR